MTSMNIAAEHAASWEQIGAIVSFGPGVKYAETMLDEEYKGPGDTLLRLVTSGCGHVAALLPNGEVLSVMYDDGEFDEDEGEDEETFYNEWVKNLIAAVNLGK